MYYQLRIKLSISVYIINKNYVNYENEIIDVYTYGFTLIVWRNILL